MVVRRSYVEIHVRCCGVYLMHVGMDGCICIFLTLVFTTHTEQDPRYYRHSCMWLVHAYVQILFLCEVWEVYAYACTGLREQSGSDAWMFHGRS